jgi:phosphate transport system permease protein
MLTVLGLAIAVFALLEIVLIARQVLTWVLIAVFLTIRAVVAIRANEGNFLTTFEWEANASPPYFGIAVLLFGTVVSSVIAMLLAVPVAVGIALFISHYAPRRIAGFLGYVVDLLAAVPSIIYGLWGALFLVPHLTGLYAWLDQFFGWTGVLSYDNTPARSLMTVGILLAIMILPIITSVTREVFLQTPKANEEAALALGATRWEVIRMTVLPFGRSGVISASMLGLGRALGETMATTMTIGNRVALTLDFHQPGYSMTAIIANEFREATTDLHVSSLVAIGLILFVLSFILNSVGRLLVLRRYGGVRGGV